MAEFTIQIAGIALGVRSLFASTRDYCRHYLSEESPCFAVEVLPWELPREQEAYRQEALEEGLRQRTFSDPFLDRSVVQRKAAQGLLDWDVLMLHGSALSLDGKGYLFTAKCGTGKSTHTRFWRECFGQRVVMVNDDKPFLRADGSGITLWGAPWSGKHGLDTNISVPLKGICILERGTENRICPLPPAEGAALLQKQAFRPEDPRTQALLEKITARVPLWRMACTRQPQAALIAMEAMTREEADA